MDLSILLARIFGVYMLILGLIVLRNPKLQVLVNELSRDDGLRFVLGLFTLVLGIALVSLHNIWSDGYRVIITIISWVVLIKGFLTVWLKEKSYKNLIEKLSAPNIITATGVINLVLGIYLVYIGFFV